MDLGTHIHNFTVSSKTEAETLDRMLSQTVNQNKVSDEDASEMACPNFDEVSSCLSSPFPSQIREFPCNPSPPGVIRV